jgi:Tol biopolymer transport system component
MRHSPIPLMLVTATVLVVACDYLADPFGSIDEDSWQPASSVDPGGQRAVNTAALEGCPIESPDGKSLYFASDRDGTIDIWVAHRNAGTGELDAPERLPEPVNSEFSDFCPTPLAGGELMFVSTRPGGCGDGTGDIYHARLHPTDGWLDPEHLGCAVNSAGDEYSPSVVQGGQLLFFSSNRTGQHDIYVSERGSAGVWGTPAAVQELNLDGANTWRPNVSPDGHAIVFDSDRPGGLGGPDVWLSTRSSIGQPWSEPVNLGTNVNSESAETRATLSRDGRRLYFGSNRPGYQGSSDIFVSQRSLPHE